MGAFPPLLAYNSSKTALNAITVAYANELPALRTARRMDASSPGDDGDGAYRDRTGDLLLAKQALSQLS